MAGTRHAVKGIERIRLDDVLPPPVSHYCDAVRAGDYLFISGIVAIDRNGAVVGKGDAARQAAQIFEHLSRMLAHFHADVSRIASVLIHLTDMQDRARINPVRIRYFGEHRPASTLVQVVQLVNPDLLVEVTCVAYLGEDETARRAGPRAAGVMRRRRTARAGGPLTRSSRESRSAGRSRRARARGRSSSRRRR